MLLPFGNKMPNDEESALLRKVGFDLRQISKLGRYYYLQFPPHLEARPSYINQGDNVIIDVYYNDIKIIKINQKSTLHESYVVFYIDKENVAQILTKANLETTPIQRESQSTQVNGSRSESSAIESQHTPELKSAPATRSPLSTHSFLNEDKSHLSGEAILRIPLLNTNQTFSLLNEQTLKIYIHPCCNFSDLSTKIYGLKNMGIVSDYTAEYNDRTSILTLQLSVEPNDQIKTELHNKVIDISALEKMIERVLSKAPLQQNKLRTG